MNAINYNKKILSLLFIVIVLFSFTSVFSLLAVKTNIAIIKIWKELCIIFVYLICIIYFLLSKKVSVKFFIFSLILPIFTTILYLISASGDNKVLVFYQFKSDILPFLFPLAMFCLIKNNEQAQLIYRKVCKLFIAIGLINVVFIFIERFFTSWFLVFLQIDDMNNQSGASGIRLDNTSNGISYGLRAMGTMTTFINAGTLMILCVFILLESKLFKLKTQILLTPLFISAAIATTYKTAMVTLAFYIPLKLFFVFIRGDIGKQLVIAVYTVLCFILMAISFNSYFLYNKIDSPDLKKAAYNSVYLRILQHNDILKDVENKSILTGVGIGVNGTQGPPEIKSKYSSKALDSTYINLLSNYGLLGVTIYLSIFMLILIKLIFVGGLGDLLACYLIFFHIGIEFFVNNMLMNFPLNVYISLIIGFSLFFKKTYK